MKTSSRREVIVERAADDQSNRHQQRDSDRVGIIRFLFVRVLFQQLVSSPFGRDGRTLGTDLGDRGVQSTWLSTLSSAWLRVLGTLIGSIISATYLSFWPFNPFGMAACIFATVLVCHAAGIPGHAQLAAITVALIMVISTMDPTVSPITSAALRFSESCLGTAMAVLAVEIWARGDGVVQPGVPGDAR